MRLASRKPATTIPLLLALTALFLLPTAARKAATPAPGPTSAATERGAYLVAVLACNDCHTPFVMGDAGPQPDMARMLSGHPQDLILPAPPSLPQGPWSWAGIDSNTAFAGPWGISYAPNLTPDENTGLGIWSEEMFVQALRTGRHMGQSRMIMPPMPWPSYSRMTDEDLKAIYAYLRTIPAVSNLAPDSRPAGEPEDEFLEP